jgi:hypothetical protein
MILFRAEALTGGPTGVRMPTAAGAGVPLRTIAAEAIRTDRKPLK